MTMKRIGKKNVKKNMQFVKAPPCHKGPIEVHPGLWLGDQDEGEDALKKGLARVAVPLNRMDGDVWEKWDGEVIYIPIKDYSVLPEKIAIRKSRELAEILRRGNAISMFCMGGHGRTGYMAALVLGRLGYEDPIKHLRDNYCSKAVESRSQIDQIADILNNQSLRKHNSRSFYGSAFSCMDYENPKWGTLGFSTAGEPARKCTSCWFYYQCEKAFEGEECKFYTEGGELW